MRNVDSYLMPFLPIEIIISQSHFRFQSIVHILEKAINLYKLHCVHDKNVIICIIVTLIHTHIAYYYKRKKN